jgi:hypothetical protein
MSESLAAPHPLIDVGMGGMLLANMLAGWLDGNPNDSSPVEAADESSDHGASPEQSGLCVCASVDTGASPSPSREHGASICPARESAGTGLERAGDPHSGPGSGNIRGTDNGPGGLQDARRGSVDGPGWRSVCLGGLAVGALEPRLASIAGVVRAHRNPGDRRRWLLQPGRFQRRPSLGIE